MENTKNEDDNDKNIGDIMNIKRTTSQNGNYFFEETEEKIISGIGETKMKE